MLCLDALPAWPSQAPQRDLQVFEEGSPKQRDLWSIRPWCQLFFKSILRSLLHCLLNSIFTLGNLAHNLKILPWRKWVFFLRLFCFGWFSADYFNVFNCFFNHFIIHPDWHLYGFWIPDLICFIRLEKCLSSYYFNNCFCSIFLSSFVRTLIMHMFGCFIAPLCLYYYWCTFHPLVFQDLILVVLWWPIF